MPFKSKKFPISSSVSNRVNGLRAYGEEIDRRVGTVEDHIYDSAEWECLDRESGESRAKTDRVPKVLNVRYNS